MQWWVLKRRVHISWLIALISGGIVVGVIAAQYMPRGVFEGIAWLIVGLTVALFSLWRGSFYVVGFAVISGVVIGLWRGDLVLRELSPYQNLVSHMVTVEGKVSEDPEVNKQVMSVLRVSVQTVDGHSMSGSIWMTTTKQGDIKRGDEVVARGVVEEGFGSFSASMYRAEMISVKRPMPGDVAARVREWFAGQVHHVLPDPQAALGIGFLTGQHQSLSPELEDAMRLAGLTHIVVASGYNLTILVRLARRLFVRISKYLAAFSGAVMIGGFVAITGLSPSMSRAGLVAGLSLAAWYYGRKFHPLVLLPFSAAVTLLVNPTYGWNDLGWMLSFAAFGGVMILAPLLQAYFFGDKKPGVLRQIMGETIAAQIVTLPILVVAFGQFSNVALLANIMVVPLVPLAMLLVFLAGMMGFLVPAVGAAIGWCANILLGYMVEVTRVAAGLPWAVTTLSIQWYGGALMYLAIVITCGLLWYKTRFDLRSANIVE